MCPGGAASPRTTARREGLDQIPTQAPEIAIGPRCRGRPIELPRTRSRRKRSPGARPRMIGGVQHSAVRRPPQRRPGCSQGDGWILAVVATVGELIICRVSLCVRITLIGELYPSRVTGEVSSVAIPLAVHGPLGDPLTQSASNPASGEQGGAHHALPPRSPHSSAMRPLGLRNPRRLRGRSLSSSATRSRSTSVSGLRSVPLGKYWRNSPLVFSLVPRCQGEWGSQK
jgi:hypothetical protein